MATAKTTAVKTATSRAVATVAEAADAAMFAFAQTVPAHIKPGAVRGSEEVKTDDLVLPRLEIVQAMSPIKDTDENAREGYMFNSVTGEIFGDTVYFVPVYYRLEWLIWKDVDSGGGFFGSHASKAEAENRVMEEVSRNNEDPNLLEIVDTPVQYGLIIKQSGDLKLVAEQVVVSMAKTKAKVSRKLNSLISICGEDRFARVYKLTTFRDENRKGQKFYNYVVAPAGYTPEHIYKQAEELYETFKTQAVHAAHDTARDNEGSLDRGDI